MQEWTRNKFEEKLNEKFTGVVYIYTPLCGTCQVASKMLEVTEALQPDLIIGKMDLNYSPKLAEQLEVESVPCALFIRDGRIKEQIYAFHSVPYLVEKIRNVLIKNRI